MATQEPRRLGSAILSTLLSLGLFFLLWQLYSQDLPMRDGLQAATSASQPASLQLVDLQQQAIFWKLSALQTLGMLALFLSRRAKNAGALAKVSLLVAVLQQVTSLALWVLYAA
jgi:hypothetical protein